MNARGTANRCMRPPQLPRTHLLPCGSSASRASRAQSGQSPALMPAPGCGLYLCRRSRSRSVMHAAWTPHTALLARAGYAGLTPWAAAAPPPSCKPASACVTPSRAKVCRRNRNASATQRQQRRRRAWVLSRHACTSALPAVCATHRCAARCLLMQVCQFLYQYHHRRPHTRGRAERSGLSQLTQIRARALGAASSPESRPPRRRCRAARGPSSRATSPSHAHPGWIARTVTMARRVSLEALAQGRPPPPAPADHSPQGTPQVAPRARPAPHSRRPPASHPVRT